MGQVSNTASYVWSGGTQHNVTGTVTINGLPTDTPTTVPSDTPVPPSDTPVPPSDTPVPPSDTPGVVPSDTPGGAPTDTPGGPPTNTWTPGPPPPTSPPQRTVEPPPPTTTGCGEITGELTIGANPAAGLPVELRSKANSGADSLIASGKTGSDGFYHFTGIA